MNNFITAVDIAREAGINPNRFRGWLREDIRCLSWHRVNTSWIAARDSPQHRDMVRVLNMRKPRKQRQRRR